MLRFGSMLAGLIFFVLTKTFHHEAQDTPVLSLGFDHDMVAAYESLGAALYAAGQPDKAIEIFHNGLQVDPLSAILYYDLGLALTKKGDEAGGARALALARAIDPGINRKNFK